MSLNKRREEKHPGLPQKMRRKMQELAEQGKVIRDAHTTLGKVRNLDNISWVNREQQGE